MVNDPNSDDVALLRQIAAHDEQALALLYARHARAVFNLALYVLQNRTTAEEVTQDVFLLVWHSPTKWRADKGKFSSWLLAVTRYMAIDRLRRERSQRYDSHEPFDDLAERLTTLTAFTASEDTTLVRALLKRLPKEQRETLFLIYFRGMPPLEIAQRMSVPTGTVKSRLRLGLEKLREWWHEAVNEQR